jgi:hypothetical protein
VLLALLIVLVVVAAFAFHKLKPDRFTVEQTRPVLSSVDGLRYRVHADHVAPQQAADALASISARVVELMRFLRAKYLRGPAGAAYPARRAAVARLLARYNPDNLAENSPQDPSGDTSYNVNKGSVIALCLRPRPSGLTSARLPGGNAIFHDLDTLTFVMLHEMTHTAVEATNHPAEFWSAFRFLLESAEEAIGYISLDYATSPTVYCGISIDWNPRWSASVAPF